MTLFSLGEIKKHIKEADPFLNWANDEWSISHALTALAKIEYNKLEKLQDNQGGKKE